MYKYEEQRAFVFTEDGIKGLLVLRDHVKKILAGAGAITMQSAMNPLCGDTWRMMALVDYLVEIRELIEIPTNMRSQDRIFVAAK